MTIERESKEVCPDCKKKMTELDDKENDLLVYICQECGWLFAPDYDGKWYQYDISKGKKFRIPGPEHQRGPAKIQCEDCKEYIVHPGREFALCLDCLIKKLLQQGKLDLLAKYYVKK